MKYSLYILSIFVFTLNSLAVENSCTEINAESRLGPIRDQRDMGWCFANTAADLLTHAYHLDFADKTFSYEFVDLNNMQVSNMFTALIYYESQVDPSDISRANKSLFGHAGYIYDTIKLAQKKGFLCSQKMDEDLMNRGFQNVTMSAKFNIFEELYKQYQDYLKGSEAAGALAKKRVEEIRASGSVLNSFNYEELKSAFGQPTVGQATLEILSIACRDSKMPITKMPNFEHYFTTRESADTTWHATGKTLIKNFDYRKHIDTVLEKNKMIPIPIGVTYDVGRIVSDPVRLGSGPHASVLTGRKMMNGSCHYRIRNSWGKACKWGYGAEAINTYKYECVSGSIWVPGTEINSLITELVYQSN